jgi:DNA mismatch endonuclease (patch repair protein)
VPDIVDAATRSRMMAGIRSKNTVPEITLRKALHRRGFRYGLHSSNVPGKPDLVFRSRRAVIFVHGCFWHGHDCPLFRLPSTRPEFWGTKIAANRKRDELVSAQLADLGWRQLVIWECATRGKAADILEAIADRAAVWLESGKRSAEIREPKWHWPT